MNVRKLTTICLFASSFAFASPNLDLESYLTQINSDHGKISGAVVVARQNAAAISLKVKEGELFLSPLVFATAQYLNDQKLNVSPTTLGNKTIADTYSFGFSKLTTFGLQAKLSYNINDYSISGASLAAIPVPRYYEIKPSWN